MNCSLRYLEGGTLPIGAIPLSGTSYLEWTQVSGRSDKEGREGDQQLIDLS